MSTETDRVIASIDRALTSDEITDIVDEQLARYDQRTGYDYSIGQPRCAHCGSDEHHLAITERIEEMRDWGLYDESYRYDEDTSRIVCPGSNVPGPVGFRRAHVREQRAEELREARRDFDRRQAERHAALEAGLRAHGYTAIGTTADGGNVLIRPVGDDPSYAEGGLVSRSHGADLTIYDEAREPILEPTPWERLRDLIFGSVQALGQITEVTDAVTNAWSEMRGAAVSAGLAVDPDRLTVRLFTSAGQPVRLGRNARVVSYEQTVTGFTVEIDGRFTRSFGVPHRILLEGPGGPRERIAGIVTELSSTPGGPIRIEAASEHRRLPTVYTEPEN
ncbi:hypothetical protein ACXYTP_07365 [Tsukamurella ocularis]|uniref:hypothetical protein n=1 Tax=Tsukamurella ocularis TaxID=1970234 RepID=UPI0039EF45E9